MKRIFALMLVAAVLTACGGPSPQAPEPVKNVFHDATLQTIYNLQNNRDGAGLVAYLKNGNPFFRRAAALAFASVQDAKAVEPLAALLTDTDLTVRCAASYALGQTGDKAAGPLLKKALETEKDSTAQWSILEALGRCGTKEDLDFVVGLDAGTAPGLLIGQAMGIYRFGLRNIVSEPGSAKAVALTAAGMPDKARFFAAHYTARVRDIDLKPHAAALLAALDAEKDLFVRMALVGGLGKAATPEILTRLQQVLSSDADHRVKVNAVRALIGFEYKEIKGILFQQAADADVNVSIAAAEFLLGRGSETDAEAYFDKALALKHWRSRATLLTAALKFAAKDNAAKDNKELKKKITAAVMDIYKKSQNLYEQSNLLGALAGDPGNVDFVEKETFAHVGDIIGTGGMGALTRMSKAAKDDEKLKTAFAGIFQKAVGTGDMAIVTMAAGILRDEEMNFKAVVKDAGFLSEALNKCKMPEDLEAHAELQKTIDFFTGSKLAEQKQPLKNAPIDWSAVAAVDPYQEVTILTSKGDIVIRLMVNDSPGSVVNFLQLIKKNFYAKSHIHRVVPNFVIQDGCPRGDGWGGPTHTIGSEFGRRYYTEGSVGMASAGKDTEGSQWFITHSPTPHLDGRYTIFAEVVSGMDVVHKIEVGDKIIGFK